LPPPWRGPARAGKIVKLKIVNLEFIKPGFMRNKSRNKKKIIVAVSGGFDPIHVGHVRMFKKAKALGDELVVILNNDNWFRIKGRHLFMPERERKEIIEALKPVDRVILSKHKPSKRKYGRNTIEYSVCRELEELNPDIFANGGDRFKDDVPEVELCKKIGCRTVFNVGQGGKIQSSSWLLKKYLKKAKRKK
jgi:D-beta-D-heptose 7-phosphate kinase/D-beta-D-heptose 1-phosphate adenosyltransferase